MNRKQTVRTSQQKAAPEKEQFLLAVTDLKITLSGIAVVLLALGIAAALGCGVVIRLAIF